MLRRGKRGKKISREKSVYDHFRPRSQQYFLGGNAEGGRAENIKLWRYEMKERMGEREFRGS